MALKRQLSGGSGGGKGKTVFSAAGSSTFTGLSDTPNAYTGEAGKVVVVKGDESGLEFSTEAAIDRHDVKVSGTDVNPQFLEDKLAMGVGMAPVQKTMFDNTLIIGTQVDPALAWGNPVKGFYDPTPNLPVLPSAGDRYISLASANGWFIDYIYEYDGAVWQPTPPANGLCVFNQDTVSGKSIVYYDITAVVWRQLFSSKNSEYPLLPSKGSPTIADLLAIEDVADGNKKKVITINSLPAATPAAHALAGAQHSADTITNLNTKLSDGDVLSTKSGEIAAITEKTSFAAADVFLMEDSADTNAKKRIQAQNMPGNLFTKGNGVYNPSGITAAVNLITWRAPFACIVTNVRGYRVGGTGATINARLNGASNHLASALSVSSADTWMDGGAVQNTVYAAGDKLEVMLVTVTGSPTQILIQVDFKRV